MKNSVKLIFASALLLTAASCAKDVALQVPGESPVRFDVGVDGTKAALVNSETDNTFKTNGFSVIAYEGATKKMDKVAVTNSGSAWTYTGEYLWKKNTEMTFYAFYPQALATSLDGKTTNAGIPPFTYSPLASGITADVTGQTDYMLATYSGAGNKGVAELTFSHPLASIQFAVGNIDESLTAINSISIGGFYTSGTCKSTCTLGEVRYTWTDTQGKADSEALSQTEFSTTIEYDSFIGEPFLLIPQIFSGDSKLEIIINATIEGVSKTLFAEVPAENFLMLEAGMTTKLNINYGGTTGNPLTFTASIIDWVGAGSELAMKEVETPDPKASIPDLSKIDFLTGDAISRSTANCYVVTETGEYKLPLVYGNAFTNGSLNPNAYANGLFFPAAYLKPFVDHAGNEISSPYILKQTNLSEENCSAEVLWEGKSGMIGPIESIEGITSLLVENGMLYFKVNQLESNAVIQLKSAGKVLWSWHIWATAKSNLNMVNVPAQDEQPAKTYKILNCNIGATATNKYGTVYQWGRRNALRSTETGSIPGPVAIKDSYNDLPVDPQGSGVWCSTFYINNWDSANINWGTGTVTITGLKHTKTIYDPCPAGFYVPSVDCFTGFTTSNFTWGASPAGRTYGGSLFPANGSGEGHYWLSAPITDEDLGSLMNFNSSAVSGKTTGSRAQCNPIRPQKIEE